MTKHYDTTETQRAQRINRKKREIIFLSACGSGPQAETGL
jgi:hypothetical protein